jgi:putative colanic acid biosysnthesis UDP-glucose lipid carrier transferase
MRSETTLDIPRRKIQDATLPNSEIANIRYMFYQMDKACMEHKPSALYYFLKRGLDIIVAVIFITLVMTWLTPILALLIKLTSEGPVFFIQKRTGRFGATFHCYKFRTMFVNDDADRKQVSINDSRITPIGKFLRITHLDETPQFFNVLLGNMSIVGPRPHMLYHTDSYSETIPYYNLRLEVKPGMTGMAQIKDYIGEINGERELRKRIQWDVYYVKHQSVGLDIMILSNTAAKVVQKAVSFLYKEK